MTTMTREEVDKCIWALRSESMPDVDKVKRHEAIAKFIDAQREQIARLEQERDEARLALADAAMEINCAGPVAHRIRVLKETHATKLAASEALLGDCEEVIDVLTNLIPDIKKLSKVQHIQQALRKA